MNSNLKSPYVLAVIFVVIFIMNNCLYVVNQTQYGVVFQFGEAVRVVEEPGLQIKIPFIQQLEYFDKRILNVEAEAKELTASDGKRVIVDAFARFQVTDPVKFYKTVHDYSGFKLRLNKILESAMRKVIGKISLTALLSDERSKVMKQIRDFLNEESEFFGVVVIDVRILRADLPKENSAAIYKRMQTEREKEAKQIRAEGLEEALKIRSTADKESQIIIAEAYMQSQTIKSEGDTESSKIYNLAYSKDPDFYKFYKSLNTYKNTLKKEDTNFILSAESELFKYLSIRK
jgi:membrane protease subunit HflC